MLTALIAAQAVAIALLAVLVAGLLRSHAEILKALHDLGAPLGDPARSGDVGEGHRHSHGRSLSSPVDAPSAVPAAAQRPAPATATDITGTSSTGDALSIAVTDVAHDTLIAFLTTSCHTCQEFWDGLRQQPTAALAPAGARLVVVTRGEQEESPPAVADRSAGASVPVVMSSRAWDDYQVPVSPFFAYVSGPTGRIVGEGAARSWAQVSHLVEQAQAEAGPQRDQSARAQLQAARRQVDRWSTDADREARADHELMAARIFPGDPRLHPNRSQR